MSRNEKFVKFQRAVGISEAHRSSDPEAGPLAEMQLAHELLDSAYFEHEADLVTTAYMNYRYQTPYQRTESFMLEFQKWYAIKQMDDYGREGRRVKKDSLAMWSKREVASFWRARQHADALGMSYGPYITATMNRAVELGYKRLPAPNQLYTPELLSHAIAVHDNNSASRRYGLLPNDCDARFFAENFAGDLVQLAALDAIEADVRMAGVSKGARRLAQYMRERRLISEDEARRRLGSELVDAALTERLLNPPRIEHLLVQERGSVPGCLGYHRAINPVCGACPAVSACMDRAGKLTGLLQAKHGTAEVRALKIKEGNRERQQRRRDRARAGMTMTLQEEKRILREIGDHKATKKRQEAKIRRDTKKAERMKGAKRKPNPKPQQQQHTEGYD